MSRINSFRRDKFKILFDSCFQEPTETKTLVASFVNDPGPVSYLFPTLLREISWENCRFWMEINPFKALSDSESEGDSMERPRSPFPKKARVHEKDNSMPGVSAGKKQATIKSYGKDGENRDKYQKNRKNPRDGPIENEIPIEVSTT